MDQSNIMLHNQYVNMTSGWEEIDNKVIAEYVWVDFTGITLRSKCKTLDVQEVRSLADIPEWDYGCDFHTQPLPGVLEVKMKPVAYFRDPFRKGNHIIVMCDTYIWEDDTFQTLVPTNTNFRIHAKKILDACPDEEPWFGIEQEYTLISNKNQYMTWPLGWPKDGIVGSQGPWNAYSVGADRCFGRIIADAHYRACLYAGVKISGTNAEGFPGQWEYQVGPVEGIAIGDHLWISRYILQRVAEDFNVIISFAPKLFEDWCGSGCHTNFSTKTMRAGNGGMEYINQMMENFAAKHSDHIAMYGDDNEKRLTGTLYTAAVNAFSYGIGNRSASMRIPTSTAHAAGRGYIEDRRPASNIDPYVVCAMLVNTAVNAEDQSADLKTAFSAFKKWRTENNLERVDH